MRMSKTFLRVEMLLVMVQVLVITCFAGSDGLVALQTSRGILKGKDKAMIGTLTQRV